MRSLAAFARPPALWVAALLALAALVYPFRPLGAQQERYEELKRQAERHYAEGSYQLAHEVYLQADALSLPQPEERWVDFRVADTLWRSQAATETPDPSSYEQARQQLGALVRGLDRPEQQDRLWAEVQESMADSWWLPRSFRNWGAAWPYYQRALEWWAGNSDLDLARERYLGILFRIARPPYLRPEDHYVYGRHGNFVPLEVLENGLKIAQTESDRAHLHFLIAMNLKQQGGDWNLRLRTPEEFEAALKLGKSSDWYDDALYHYAEWLAGGGRIEILDDGQVRQEPDPVRALQLFRRLVKEFRKGETRYYDLAAQQIEAITKAVVSVSVSNVFLPGSEIQYHLSWRNVKRIDLALYPVDLSQDVRFKDPNRGPHDWVQHVDVSGKKPVRTWSRNTGDDGTHKPGQEQLWLEGKLPLGAYLLEARAGAARGRDLVLVTDTAVVLKASPTQALAYVCDAVDSSPRPGARVQLWQRYHQGNQWHWREASAKANAQGIAVLKLVETDSNEELYAGVRAGDHQAFSLGNGYHTFRPGERSWRVYTFTDRPAYRPGETAQWKLLVREYDGASYSTPANQTLRYEIRDPRGAEVAKGEAKLNAFGSAWGSLDLTETMPLGQYTVSFWDAGRDRHVGSATLLRLEEYKLPEFKVTIRTPEEKGRRKAYRMGETVEAEIQADYYFGGPVSNASVEVVITQHPFYHTWSPPREFAWYYSDIDPRPYPAWGGGQAVKRETLRTDAQGKARVSFDTPRFSREDFEYRIEARVVDASRREITARDSVRVTRQRYYVHLRPRHKIYKPSDKVTVDVKALDANKQPVQAEGTVKVTRDYWYEIWLDPQGREVKGDRIERLREKYGVFPPPNPKPPKPGWRLKFRGYEHEDILTRRVPTDAEGEAEITFTAPKDGYYRVHWSSRDSGAKGSGEAEGAPAAVGAQGTAVRRPGGLVPPRPTHVGPVILADATVFVATNKTTDLGYRTAGLEIVVDKDTFRAGQTAPVMLSVAVPDRYVLLSVEGQDLYNYQLVHVTGTAKLVSLPITEKHVPNIFLNADMVSDRQTFRDTKQVVVPPVRQFLQVEVKADREERQPGEEGTLTVSTRDAQGKPVSAEVALGLVDESVYAIQEDLAGDPRQFYYGQKRGHVVQTQSTLQYRSYARVTRAEMLAQRESEAKRRSGGGGRDYFGLEEAQAAYGGSAGGPRGATAARAPEGAMPAPAAPASAAVALDGLARKQSVSALDKSNDFKALGQPAEPGKPGAGEEPAVQVRSDFRSTVFWQPDVVTDARGLATVSFRYPDSTTSWKATARVATQANQFGIGDAATRTKQPLIVRLQAPRFFLVGDTVTISAVVNNNTEAPVQARLDLKADGLEVTGVRAKDQAVLSSYIPDVRVPASGESRVDWTVAVRQPGSARVRVTAVGHHPTPLVRAVGAGEAPAAGSSIVLPNLSDAMERVYPVYEHGIEKLVARSGKVRGDGVTVKLDIPAERKPDSTSLVVQVTPSLAVTMLDALPYLIDYPYGCTEQTMSRFLPAAITAKTLRDLGLKPEEVEQRIFGGIEPGSAEKTHPEGKKDLDLLGKMARQGLERLYDFQHDDGGWGWWKEGDSDHYMTAYVVWGLVLARDAGIDVRGEALQRGVSYLDKEIVEAEEQPDLQAWMLHALAAHHASTKRGEPTQFQARAFDNLWTKRDSLNAYTRALLTLCAHYYGAADRARTLIDNLANGVKVDSTPDTSVVMEGPQTSQEGVMATAHWGEDRIWRRWSEGGIEGTAFALRALLAVDPSHRLVEPVTNWLIKNRRGAQWTNTRDTAIAVLALNDYLRRSGELSPDLEYELQVNGRTVETRKIGPEDLLTAPSRITIDRALVRDGVNEVRILRRSGSSPLYFAAEARFFSLEEPIAPAGSEIFVRRQYFRLVGRPTLLKGYVYDKIPLRNGETLKSGERVECLITVEGKNNYEYLVFEDLKPAGFEAVEVRSGMTLTAQQVKSSAVERRLEEAEPASPEAAPAGDAEAAEEAAGARAEAEAEEAARAEEARKLKAAGKPLPGRIIPPPRPAPPGPSDHTGQTRGVYQELRDRKVALFIDKLPEGVWEIRYTLRAETPGAFHALPVVGYAMYVPEIRCNGTETHVSVVDQEQ